MDYGRYPRHGLKRGSESTTRGTCSFGHDAHFARCLREQRYDAARLAVVNGPKHNSFRLDDAGGRHEADQVMAIGVAGYSAVPPVSMAKKDVPLVESM